MARERRCNLKNNKYNTNINWSTEANFSDRLHTLCIVYCTELLKGSKLNMHGNKLYIQLYKTRLVPHHIHSMCTTYS